MSDSAKPRKSARLGDPSKALHGPVVPQPGVDVSTAGSVEAAGSKTDPLPATPLTVGLSRSTTLATIATPPATPQQGDLTAVIDDASAVALSHALPSQQTVNLGVSNRPHGSGETDGLKTPTLSAAPLIVGLSRSTTLATMATPPATPQRTAHPTVATTASPSTPRTPSSTFGNSTPNTPSSSASQHSLSAAASRDAVSQRLSDFRHALLHETEFNEYYLGDPEFNPRTALQWVSWEGMNILASTEEAERYRHEMEIYCHDPINVTEPDLPRSADLVGVFKMEYLLYFLTADGNWQEEGRYAKPFDSCKATFLGSEPLQDNFALDFPTVEKNVRTIVDMARGDPRGPLKGLYQKLNDGRNLLKFSHKMFEALEAGETVAAVPHNEYTIKGWPARHGPALKALAKMTETHRVNVLPAFDISGEPIRPSFYAQRMRGCDARIHFSITHWPIEEKKTTQGSDTIVCDAQQIQVLVGPPPKRGQKGRRSFEKDVFTPFGSPSKKARID
ncbi:hypothetical protein PHLCEN_2v3114 [Hermanssonia centrifuga]|uniref:Uncharacterized protein n=1 Tax=Hermanssonia centrifuga TaxID=98765 RepID=A0A2R6R3Z1_9APHY|nr:hypothetical protein PHLCEN_2v3114 [Hermanssonia centrifuga]